MGRSTLWRCRKTGGWELTQVRIMKIMMTIIIMSQKLQTPPRWSPSSFSPPSFSTLPFNSGNKVGAGFGTGYCDAQCPHDVKYINGEPNSQVVMVMVMVYFLVMVMMTMTISICKKMKKGLDPKRDGRQSGFRAFWLMLLRTRYLGGQ